MAVAALGVGSWWAEDLRAAAPGYRRLWDILTVGFLAYAALDLLFLAESFIAAVIHLLLFLVVYKLYNMRSHRDILDLFILTFLELVAASTLTASFGFLLSFCLYMILGIWGLILFHLKREAELNLPERSRDLLGAPGSRGPRPRVPAAGAALRAPRRVPASRGCDRDASPLFPARRLPPQ